jgi:hypothetical protein
MMLLHLFPERAGRKVARLRGPRLLSPPKPGFDPALAVPQAATPAPRPALAVPLTFRWLLPARPLPGKADLTAREAERSARKEGRMLGAASRFPWVARRTLKEACRTPREACRTLEVACRTLGQARRTPKGACRTVRCASWSVRCACFPVRRASGSVRTASFPVRCASGSARGACPPLCQACLPGPASRSVKPYIKPTYLYARPI